MAVAEEKRRPTSRTRKEKFVVKGTPLKVDRTWSNEVLGVVCLAVASFLLVSFLSQQYYRTAYITSETLIAARDRNIMGPMGHLTATMLNGALGWSTLVMIGWVIWVGVFIWRNELWHSTIEVRSKPILALGLLGLFVFSATVLFVIAGRPGGGSIGQFIGDPLLRLFGLVGAVTFSVTFFLLSVAVSSRRSVADVLKGTVRSFLFVLGFLFGTLPVMTISTLRAVGATLKLGADFLYLAITGREYGTLLAEPKPETGLRDVSEEEVLPKPRARRKVAEPELSVIDGEKKEVEALPASSTRTESFSHVVVSRRKPESAGSNREKERKEKTIKEQDRELDVDRSFPDYVRPDLSLLTRGEIETGGEDDEELLSKSRVIENKLKDFGVQGRITQVHPGPVVTLFEFEPAPGVKVGKIAALQDDLAMSLRATAIRVIAPLPKKGTVGIEVPNKQREIVRLRDLLESEAFINAESILSIPLGKDTYGDPVIADIATMPHLLMAGSTGTGKSVSINTLLMSLLYRASPADLGLILIDPKILELSIYDGIPHLRVPVVTVPQQAKAVLQWAVKEMDRRYRMMQKFGVRSIDSYNRVARGEENEEDCSPRQQEAPLPPLSDIPDEEIIGGAPEAAIDDEPVIQSQRLLFSEPMKPLPKIVIVIDELADLMLTVGREIEELITRLAQKARAAGIHLILATQRPSVDVITGLIKANFPARVSFRVSSRIDSRTILDSMGAEKLLGRGDMLVMFPGAVHLRRVHGAFIADSEVRKVVESIKSKCKPQYDERIMELCDKALAEEGASKDGQSGESGDLEYDEFYDKAVELVLEKGQASTSMVQRVFRIGYNRAARIIETMEKEGIIGPMDGVKPREVLLPSTEDRAVAGDDNF